MIFDHVTAYLIAGAVSLFVPGVVWSLLSDRKIETTAWWCGGGVLVGVGTLWMTSAQPFVPGWLYTSAGPALFFWGIHLKIRTLRSVLSWPYSGKSWLTLLVIYIAIGEVVDFFGRGYRNFYYLFSHIVLYGYLAWLARRVHQLMKYRSVLWIFWGYMAVELLLLAMPLSNLSGQQEFWRVGWSAGLLAVLGIFLTFTNHVAYMGLVLEKSWIGEKAARESSASLFNKNIFNRMFWVSERERILANVSRKLTHEINQSLTSASATVALMRRAWKDQRWTELNMPGLVDRLDRSLQQANQVLNQISPLAKSRAAHWGHLDLDAVVRQAIDLMDVSPGDLSLHNQLAGGCQVMGSRFELTQVMVNLIRNAQQACEMSGVAPRLDIRMHVAGPCAVVTVCDNGPGFDREALRKAGEEIFTTKDQGMGLGLWISKEIVGRFAGELHMRNRPEGGAEVTLLLPLSKAS